MTILNRKFGPYILLKRLAVGGMAELFLAIKLGPGGFEKIVVIKCIIAQFNDDADYVRLFYREAELAGRLNHPNVVQTFDCDVFQGTHYMVMEHMPGVTVAEMAERGAESNLPLPQEFAIKICIDACEGLHYSHWIEDNDGVPLGVVHRDISPQNIFVTFDGLGKVFDFGIARLASDEQDDPHGGMLAGKYAYMSPEQCRGDRIDGRSDVFSLGIILYELTTGYRLFKREDQVASLRAITEDRITPPSELLDRYPRFLERIVMKALARDVSERHSDALELADDLRKFLKISGSKPTTQLLGTYVSELFTREIAEFAVYRKHAIVDVEAAHGRVNPLEGLVARSKAQAEEFVADDEELVPELGPQMAAPSPDDPPRVHIPERPTGPQRLAAVAIAEEDTTSEEAQRRVALVRARRVNRILGIIALLAVIGGLVAVVYFINEASQKPAEEKDQTGQETGSTSTGVVKISSVPYGAEVWLNGTPRQDKTPAELQVPFGETVELELRLEGYEVFKKTLTLSEGQKRFVVDAKLKVDEGDAEVVKTAAVRVVSTPASARVVFDGQAQEGLTPVIIQEAEVGAEHVLVIDADGHETLIFPFNIEEDSQLELPVELRELEEKKMGTLVIDSWPRGARVEINETYAGITPLPPLRLEGKKEYVIGVTYPNLQPHLETIELKRGGSVTLSPRLGGTSAERIDPATADDAAQIDINSTPPTEVFVDSQSIGTAPLELVMVLPGTHWIEFRDDALGIRHVEVVSFKANEVTDINVNIPKGTLKVESSPPGAAVTVDGNESGVTPLELEIYVGEHAVKLDFEGKTREIQASVRAKKTFTINETF